MLRSSLLSTTAKKASARAGAFACGETFQPCVIDRSSYGVPRVQTVGKILAPSWNISTLTVPRLNRNRSDFGNFGSTLPASPFNFAASAVLFLSHKPSHSLDQKRKQSMRYVAGQGIKVAEPPANIRLNSATP
jgi:hypothetical protein